MSDNSGQHSQESKKLQESWHKKLKRWIKEQPRLCPHCGYYCHGKSVFCLPPILEPRENK